MSQTQSLLVGCVRSKGRGLVSAAATVFTLFFPRTLRSGRTIFGVLLALTPLALVIFLGSVDTLPSQAPRGARLFEWLIGLYHLQFLCPFLGLLYGSHAVAEDIDGRTAVYLLTRPIPRSGLALGKWLVASACAALLVVASVVLTYVLLSRFEVGAGLSGQYSLLLKYCAVAGGGVVVYAAVFTALGAWVKRALLVGLVLTSIWEVVVANIPAPVQGATILFRCRVLLAALGVEPVVIGPKGRFLVEEIPGVGAALLPLGVVLVVAVGLSCLALHVRRYALEK
jgi:hypothetical protein